ncbi:hypothetical protein BN1221_02539 [Brenneria goodwinii]|uniref:Uncharacterized protein n=1 Tax=Brenneria goodwinii TaxID=1109412 RepID=A0A0G4JW21_9GAMM|nr:hypothetical protein BN1221_02539 [Brenneria goodwinii]
MLFIGGIAVPIWGAMFNFSAFHAPSSDKFFGVIFITN